VSNSELAREPYVNLETFKRDGSGVKTPVWCAPLNGTIVIFTDGTSFKVKRLRRNQRVRVAACDVRGKLRGDWREGSCEIVDDPALEARSYEALLAKYGWQMRLINLSSTLFGRIQRRKILAVTLDEAAG
jgi:PPOX class probable F420-dependent enzyme